MKHRGVNVGLDYSDLEWRIRNLTYICDMGRDLSRFTENLSWGLNRHRLYIDLWNQLDAHH